MEFTNAVSTDKIKLNNIAHQNPSTLNPLINALHSRIITALITNKNKPKVSTVSGKLKKLKIGFTVTLKSPKTIEKTIAVPKLLM